MCTCFCNFPISRSIFYGISECVNLLKRYAKNLLCIRLTPDKCAYYIHINICYIFNICNSIYICNRIYKMLDNNTRGQHKINVVYNLYNNRFCVGYPPLKIKFSQEKKVQTLDDCKSCKMLEMSLYCQESIPNLIYFSKLGWNVENSF